MAASREGAEAARNCFNENIANLGRMEEHDEKFNLYNGLFNLAVSMERIEAELAEIRQALQRRPGGWSGNG